MTATQHFDTSAGPRGSRPAVLDAVVAASRLEMRGAAEKLAAALAWAHAHPGSDGDCASWDAQLRIRLARDDCEDRLDCLGGEGTPPVAEFAVEQLATRLGVSTGSAMSLVADALNLAHRHPILWSRVLGLCCPAWVARKVATACALLPLEGARWVDERTGSLAGRCAWSAVDRQIAYAVAKWCPQETKDAEDQAKDSRKLDIHLPSDKVAGGSAAVADVYGRLSTTDAIKFDALVAATAQELARTGDTSSLDLRRAKALGLIADQLLSGELDLDTCPTDASTDQTGLSGLAGAGEPEADEHDSGSGEGSGRVRLWRWVVPARKAASTTLFVHVSMADLATAAFAARDAGGAGGAGAAGLGPVDLEGLPIGVHDPAVGWVEKHGALVLDTVREWLGETNATIRPILDLTRTDAVDQHDPPAWMREIVIQRDGHCVFPWCGAPARSCDLDHIIEYVPLDQGGSPGQTSPANLAPLCRRHHRCKTFTRWSYRRRPDGSYEWTDPGGARFVVFPGHGTYQLTEDGGPPDDTGPPGDTTPEPPDPGRQLSLNHPA